MAIQLVGGTGNNIAVPYSGNENAIQSFSVTMWGWVNTTSTVTGSSIVTMVYPSHGSYIGIAMDSNTENIDFGNESNDYTVNIHSAQWCHIACCNYALGTESSRIKGYINGKVRISTSDSSGVQGDWAAAGFGQPYLMIGDNSVNDGGTPGSTLPWPGYYQDVRFWGRYLSAADILKDMNSPVPDQKGLIGWLPLNDNYVTDASGNGNQWTLTGTAPNFVQSRMLTPWLPPNKRFRR